MSEPVRQSLPDKAEPVHRSLPDRAERHRRITIREAILLLQEEAPAAIHQDRMALHQDPHHPIAADLPAAHLPALLRDHLQGQAHLAARLQEEGDRSN